MNLVKATKENFNEIAYLLANSDVAYAVMEGGFFSGYAHFLHSGMQEGRNQLSTAKNDASLEAQFQPQDMPIAHKACDNNLIKSVVKPGMRVLEIGSREVTGPGTLRKMVESAGAQYVGFDYYLGDNVDIAGDAHKLSSYFDVKFDFIYSAAVLEHLAMPWVVAAEIAKVLNVNGYLLVVTHFAFSAHERPWDFFRFSDMGLKVLFNPAFGFNCIDAGFSNPVAGKFGVSANDFLRGQPVGQMYCHSNYFGKKVREAESYEWSRLDLSSVVGETVYPAVR
jgi:SAM-dependent methyltransferase